MSDTPMMYRATVPVLQRALRNLANVLEKGRAHAEARKIDPAVLLGCRLAPDMFALTRQVQIAADIAKAGAARSGKLSVLFFSFFRRTVLVSVGAVSCKELWV